MAESVDINAPLDNLSVFDVHSFEVHVRDLYFIGGQLLKTFKALFTNLKPWANIQIFCNIIDIWRYHNLRNSYSGENNKNIFRRSANHCTDT